MASKSFSEYVLAGTAFFVSLTTLGVYIYQAKVMKEQQHVAVWPYVEWSTSNVEDYRFSVQNKGVGPAIIRDVVMTLDGQPIRNNLHLLQELLGKDANLPEWVNSSLKGRVLLPGELVVPLRIKNLQEGRGVEAKLRARRFDMQITYCSVYGDCWKTDGDKVTRQPQVDLGLR